MSIFFATIFIFNLNVWSATLAEKLPPDAQEFLKKLPGETLTLDFVLMRAAEKTKSFRAALAQELLIDAARHRGDIPHDWQVSLFSGSQDDQRQPTNAFAPSRIKGSSTQLGVTKYFSTGTAFSAEIEMGHSDIEIPSMPAASNYESKATVSLRQNLWKDAFGSATRKVHEASVSDAESQSAVVKDQLQGWALGITEIYYAAWTAKQNALAAKKDLARRLKMEKIMGVRSRRGTSDNADLLHVRAATNGARAMEAQSLLAIQNIWNELVIKLELPREWQNFSATLVPLSLDEPIIEAQQLCDAKTKPSTLALTSAEAQSRAVEARMQAAKSNAGADIYLQGAYGTNGVDPDSASTATEETLGADHPYWALGIGVTIPLGNHAAKAEIKSLSAQKYALESHLSEQRDQQILAWQSGCAELNRLLEAEKLMSENFKLQSDRAKLEEQRYGLGRTNVLNYIQSQDDATMAERGHYQTSASLRLQAWRIKALGQTIYKKLEPVISAAKDRVP